MPLGFQQAHYDLGYLDALSRGQTWVHRLDPRAKLLATLALIVTVVSFNRYALSPLIPFVLYPVVIVAVGNVSLGYLLRRVAWVLPLVLLLGIFNPLLDRHPVVVFGSLEVAGGWLSLLSMILRVVLTVAAAMTLIAVTGMQSLGAALERLGVPRVFVVQLLFVYRYLFVLVEEASNMARARAFRSGGKRGGGWRSYGPLVGHLLLRTYDRAQRIHLAMVSRGFDGEVRLVQPLHFGLRDAAFLLGWVAFFFVLRFVDASSLLGTLLIGAAR